MIKASKAVLISVPFMIEVEEVGQNTFTIAVAAEIGGYAIVFDISEPTITNLKEVVQRDGLPEDVAYRILHVIAAAKNEQTKAEATNQPDEPLEGRQLIIVSPADATAC